MIRRNSLPAGTGCRRRQAFTLVELLVVIGIIALLVGILLPALGKARQQAQTIKCLANLHALGLAVTIYSTNFHGSLPYGYWDGSTPPAGAPANGNSVDWAILLMSSVFNKGAGTYGSQNGTDASTLQPVFACPSAAHFDDGGQIARKLHYGCHPRLMPDLADTDGAVATHPYLRPWKLSQVTHSSEIALLWDAAQVSSLGWNAFAVSKNLDASGLYYAASAGDKQWNYLLASPGLNLGAAIYASNGDTPPNFANGADLRWRHGRNDACNLVFADCHAETFRLKFASNADAKVRNFYVTPRN